MLEPGQANDMLEPGQMHANICKSMHLQIHDATPLPHFDTSVYGFGNDGSVHVGSTDREAHASVIAKAEDVSQTNRRPVALLISSASNQLCTHSIEVSTKSLKKIP